MLKKFRNDKCGRGKRQAASDKQQPEILSSNSGQIWTMLPGHWPLGYMNTIIWTKTENRQGSQLLTIFLFFSWFLEPLFQPFAAGVLEF